MARVLLLVVALLVTIPGVAPAGEQLDLSTPIVQATITQYTVDKLLLFWSSKIVQIDVMSTATGTRKTFVYDASTTPTGQTLMRALNKADLSVKSLQRRILERLALDGHLVGTVSGTPD